MVAVEAVPSRAAYVQGNLQWVRLVDARKGLIGQELAKNNFVSLVQSETCTVQFVLK